MNLEQLLKSISDMLKKNEQFFNDNPELAKAVQERFYKAVNDEDGWEFSEYTEGDDDRDFNDHEMGSDEEDFYNLGYDDSGLSSMFDDLPDEDVDENQDGHISEDEGAQWLAENDPELIEESEDIDGDGDLDIPDHVRQMLEETDEQSDEDYAAQTANQPGGTKPGGRMLDWAPQQQYKEHHQALIDQYMGEGFSHREAERMANASPWSGNPFDSNVKGNNPSDKMLSILRPLAGNYLRDAMRGDDKMADMAKNPVKAMAAKVRMAHEDAHGEFGEAYNAFLQSDEVKDLRGKDRRNAIRAWKKEWHEQNPGARENMISVADADQQTFQEAADTRAKHLQEQQEALLDANKMGDVGEFSTALSNMQGDMGGELTDQGIAEAVGGQKTEQGFTTNVKKDPMAHFAEQNPELVETLKQKREGLKNALSHPAHSEISKRFSALPKKSEGEQ